MKGFAPAAARARDSRRDGPAPIAIGNGGRLRIDKDCLLGKGTYGRVYSGRLAGSGARACSPIKITAAGAEAMVAVKAHMNTSHTAPVHGDPTGAALRERGALESLAGCPGVPPLLAVLGPEHNESGLSHALVTPRANRSLNRATNTGNRLPAAAARRIFVTLLKALAAAHARGLIHRDVSEGNVLILDEEIYLGDWGTARSGGLPSPVPITSYVTALWYRAPELLLGESVYGGEIDVWSAGVIGLICLGGRGAWPLARSTVTRRRHALRALPQLFGGDSDVWAWARGLPLHQEFVTRILSPVPGIGPAARIRREFAVYGGALPETGGFLTAIEAALTLDPSRRPTARALLELMGETPPPAPAPVPRRPPTCVCSAAAWRRASGVIVEAVGNTPGLPDFIRRVVALRALEYLEHLGGVRRGISPDLAYGAANLAMIYEDDAGDYRNAPMGPRQAHLANSVLARLPEGAIAGVGGRLAGIRAHFCGLSQSVCARAEFLLMLALQHLPCLHISPRAICRLCVEAALRSVEAAGAEGERARVSVLRVAPEIEPDAAARELAAPVLRKIWQDPPTRLTKPGLFLC